MRLRRSWQRDEVVMAVAGLVGLTVAAFVSCKSSDSSAIRSADDAGAEQGGSGGVVTADCAIAAGTTSNTAAVVTAAEALLVALTAEQRSDIQYERTLANAQQWSNFPTTFVERNGVRIGDMSSAAQAAAVALAELALGSTGATLFSELREADEFLVTDGAAASSDYGRGLYYFSLHGTPSTSDPWLLQIGGHHLAFNLMYGGACTSGTPLFDGVEPTTWTDSEGNEHAPLEAQRAAVVALLESVAALDGAELSGTFGDLVNGPAGGGPGGGGGGDTKYPASLSYPTGTTGRGVSGSSLSSEQKALVKTAIEAWVQNVADPIASALLAEYESDEALDQTYVGYSGATDLTTQSSYARIDGPRVWIELTVQGGIVYRDRVHYHTIWRDKASDYGAEYVLQ
jgi:uncharacterized protein DUF3500